MKKIRFTITILAFTIVIMLSGCVAISIPSPTHLYHKDNFMINGSLGYGGNSFEVQTWINKSSSLDTGASFLYFAETTYTNYSGYIFLRKWFKSGETVFANLGGAIPVSYVDGQLRYPNFFGGGSFITNVQSYFFGLEGFGSIGYFGEVFSISLTGRLGGGIPLYLFASLLAQLNIMPIRNFGFGVEAQAPFGVGQGVIVLSPIARIFLNITF